MIQLINWEKCIVPREFYDLYGIKNTLNQHNYNVQWKPCKQLASFSNPSHEAEFGTFSEWRMK